MVALLKNHYYIKKDATGYFRMFFGDREVIISAVAYPIIMLPSFRFFILRKARGLRKKRGIKNEDDRKYDK